MVGIGGFSRSFPFRVTYENILSEVEHADEEAKKAVRLPRSYEESDKKLKTVKIVTKKGDVAMEENKKKKSKQLATSNKHLPTIVQNDEEVENDEEENNEEPKEIEESSVDQEATERVPLEEVQQPTMSVAEKLQAIGKKPGPYSKTAATYEKDFIFFFIRLSFSKASPKPEKGKSKKLQAPSNINKMNTNGLDYSGKADAGKVVSIISRQSLTNPYLIRIPRENLQ